MIYLKIYHQLPNSLQIILQFFSVVHDISVSSLQLHELINWAYQWKMSFNSEGTKQAQEVVFSCKSQKSLIPQFILITPQ